MLTSILFNRLGILFSIWATAVCVLLSTSTAALGSDECGSLDRAANAIRLTQILLPELKKRELSLQFSGGSGPLSGSTDARSLLISFDKPEVYPPKEARDQVIGPLRTQEAKIELELPIYLEFDFVKSVLGKTGRAVRTQLSCQPLKFMNRVGSKQIHEVADVINAHPEWTDAQDLEAARKAGMRFGPDARAELLGLLPLKGLSSIYGPLHITRAEFVIAGPKEPGSYFADLHWYVTAKRSGTTRKMQIMVEPFRGKITAITE